MASIARLWGVQHDSPGRSIVPQNRSPPWPGGMAWHPRKSTHLSLSLQS